MAQQNIELGTTANNGQDGDDARTAFTKVNANFGELYLGLGNSQPISAKLTALAGAVWSANQMLYMTGAETVATTPLTVAARALLDDADSPAMRVTLGLGGQILQALQALTMSANGVPYFASASTMAVASSTTIGRSLWNIADAAAGRSILALGTAAPANLLPTTSTTGDGYVMRTGDGGVLGAPLNATDANACTMIGARYRVTSPFTNCPSAGAYLIEVCQYDNEITQIAKSQGGLTSRIYARQRSGTSTWGGWGEMLITGSGPLAAGGVLEIGQVLDFHYGGTSVDFSARLGLAGASDLDIITQGNTGQLRLYASGTRFVSGDADYSYSFRSGRLDALNQAGTAWQPFTARATSFTFSRGSDGVAMLSVDGAGNVSAPGNMTAGGHVYANYWHFSNSSGGRIAMSTSHGLEFHWNNGFYYRIDGNAYVLINSSPSDRSVKNVEREATNEEAGAIVDQLAGLAVSFNYKQNAPLLLPEGSRFGWVAQEAAEVLPTLFKETGVPEGEEDSTILTYNEDAPYQMIALLMKTVSELRERVSVLESQGAEPAQLPS